MRDIRDDLQDRVNLCEEQIRASLTHFEQKAQQLAEMEHSVGELRSVFATIETPIHFEKSVAGNVVTLERQPMTRSPIE